MRWAGPQWYLIVLPEGPGFYNSPMHSLPTSWCDLSPNLFFGFLQFFFFFPSSDLASTNSGHSDCSISMANLSPLASPANLLQQTEDQIPSNLEGPFVNLLPPLLQEDYLLSLGEEEGISDLFDAYDLEKLPLVEDFMCS